MDIFESEKISKLFEEFDRRNFYFWNLLRKSEKN